MSLRDSRPGWPPAPHRPRRIGRLTLLATLVGAMLMPPGAVLPATTGPSGLPVPRFVSLGSDKINVRRGPGQQYPIVWVYVRRGLPVEVVAEYDLWRQIRDHDNTVGWVQKNLLSGKRTGLVTGGVRTLHSDPSPDSAPVALLEPGVLGEIRSCRDAWCAFRVKGYDGWLRREDLWGVFPDETVE